MWVKIVSIGFCFLNLVNISEGALYFYKRSYRIYDHQNWENQYPQKHCDGLILPKMPMGVITAKQLEVKQITFGLHMSFIFNDDTDIEFNENSKSIMNCIKLNSSEMTPHFWHDPANWMIQGKEDNTAVPDIERIPGEYDDVIFPNGILTGRVYIDNDITIKSFQFGTEKWSNYDYQESLKDSILSDILMTMSGSLNIQNRPCLDESGCDSGNEIAYRSYCTFVDLIDTFDCLNPIEAIGFCNLICGASIVLKPRPFFKIKLIEEKLKQYDSDTHVSKVKNSDGEEVIQIIFTEKKFTGNSLEEAEDLNKKLIEEKIIDTTNSEILASGYYYKEGASTKTTLSLVLGTLVTVGLLFGLLFLIFDDKGRFASARERIGLGQGPLTYRSFLFSRNLSVSEGTGLIIERQSVAGSLHNIPKSFENPSFSQSKKKSPSTSEASNSSEEEEPNDIKSKDVQKMDLDLFEDQERRELIENVAEEGELVDLSEMK